MQISTIPSTEVENVIVHEIESESPKKRRKWCHIFKYFSPDEEKVNLLITKTLTLILFCLFLYGLLNKGARPGTEVFAVLALGLFSVIGGKIIGWLKLPPLLGMMTAGFLFRNLNTIPYYHDISQVTISASRKIALSYILLRAGIELDSSVLKKLKMVVFRLTIIPCLVETACVGVFLHFLLHLPWIFSTLLGFIVSAVSPAVVLPIVLNLEEKGFGVTKGIPTLIMAAASLDDILAIAGFTVCFSVAFSNTQLAWSIIKGPLEPLVGLAYGAVFGIVFWYFPSKHRKLGNLVYYNVLLLSFAAISNMFASERLGIPGAGPLGCITVAFVSSISWRKNSKQFAGVQSVVSVLWEIIQPFLFAFIGAEVTIKSLYDNAGFGTLSLVLGLICRCFVTTLVCFGAGMNWKEKLFICCAWLPKATVQAAIGSHALDYARMHLKDEDLVHYGKVILNVSVLSIFLTAPLGAILTSLLGPYLLTKDEEPSHVDGSNESTSVKVLQQEPGPSDYGSIGAGPSTDSLVPRS